MSVYTLTHSELVKGWPSYYSFYPDFMIGMNNFFYTFKGGNLYRHNVNANRNTFYLDWWTQVGTPELAYVPSRVIGVINDVPLENKLFKTISIIGDDAWSADLHTDIQASGFIDVSWFEKKEQSYFAYVRNTGTVPAEISEYPLRSVNGIGRSLTISGPAAALIVAFSIDPLISIGGIISVGDMLYYALPPYDAPILCGKVLSINVDLPSGENNIVVDTTITGGSVPGIQNPYIMFIKSSIAESHGVLGHYMVFDIQNSNTSKVELFSVESSVMKSYP